jgi:hypothetical protein
MIQLSSSVMFPVVVARIQSAQAHFQQRNSWTISRATIKVIACIF